MKIDNIILFWADKGLANSYSSTYHSNFECFDYLDTVVQVKYLMNIIQKFWGNNSLNILDVGAGVGRLSIPLAEIGHYVVALEPAESLYEELLNYRQNKKLENLECINELFENYKVQSDVKFDIIIFSGVLYFYDDSSLNEILDKTQNLLNKSGIIMVRDFFSKQNIDTKSSAIPGARLRYRPFSFWENILSNKSMQIIHKYIANPKRAFQRKLFTRGIKIFGIKFNRLLSQIYTSRFSVMFSYLIRLTNFEKYLRYDLLRGVYPSMITITFTT